MSNKKDYLKGLSQEDIKVLRSLSKIYVKFIVKQVEEQKKHHQILKGFCKCCNFFIITVFV